jgi:hypothetical protein
MWERPPKARRSDRAEKPAAPRGGAGQPPNSVRMPDPSGQQVETQLRELVTQMRIGAPTGTIYLGIYKAMAHFAIPRQQSYIYGLRNEFGRMFVILETNYEDRGVNVSVPFELRYFALTLCPPGMATAAQMLYQSVGNTHTACMISANAGAEVPRETLITEFPFGQWESRAYRQLPFQRSDLPWNGRFLERVSTIKFAVSLWGSSDRERLMIASGHYVEALRVWGEAGKPLVLLHLYIAVEALTKVIYRRELAASGLSEDNFIRSRGINPTDSDGKYRALGQTRLATIFQGDNATYQSIREASNGIEHGYANFAEIWAVPFEIAEKTAHYLRSAILSALDLRDEDLANLEGQRYRDVSRNQPPPSIQGTFGIRPPAGLGIRPIIEPENYRTLNYQPELEEVVEDGTLGDYSFKYRGATAE